MTRYARAHGSKSSNKKVADVGTPWLVLKKGLSKKSSSPSSASEHVKTCRPDSVSRVYDFADKGNVWCVMDKPSQLEACKAVRRNDLRLHKSPSIVKEPPPFKPSSPALPDKRKDKSIGLDNKMVSRPQHRQESDDPIAKGKLDKMGVKSKKKKELKCFKCRGSDHVYKDCPENSETGICYICGSSEHTFRNCKTKKRHSNRFNFATCFVCKEQGHIASSCPDNPVGLYPYGGACHNCGEVTHFSKDCPSKQRKALKNSFTLQTWSNGNLEGLSEDLPRSEPPLPNKSIKIVNF